jgi:hypothetical protein
MLHVIEGITAERDGVPLTCYITPSGVDGPYLRGLPMCGKRQDEFIPAVQAGRWAIWDRYCDLEPFATVSWRAQYALNVGYVPSVYLNQSPSCRVIYCPDPWERERTYSI